MRARAARVYECARAQMLPRSDVRMRDDACMPQMLKSHALLPPRGALQNVKDAVSRLR